MTDSADDDRYARARRAYAIQLEVPEEELEQRLAELLGERMAADAMAVGETAWVDDALSLRDRSLIVLAALAAQGGVESRMRGHVRLALAHGLTPEELEAAMALLGVYAGYPKASVAIEVVADELEQLGRPIPKRGSETAG